MVSKPPIPRGDLEYAILCALWDMGSASARQIYARVGEPDGSVYTTTAKVLDRLFEKGLVDRQMEGKAFLYRATVTRDATERRRVKATLAHLFGSSPRPAIAHLVEAVETIDPSLLDELAREVSARRRSRRGS
jgi:BlaI family penicillinase repressor